MPRPMPRLEPVTRATLPASPRSMGAPVYPCAEVRPGTVRAMTVTLLARAPWRDRLEPRHRLQGQRPPLTRSVRAGRGARCRLAARGIDGVVSSDLARAGETAEIVAVASGRARPGPARDGLRLVVGAHCAPRSPCASPRGSPAGGPARSATTARRRDELTARVVAALLRHAAGQRGSRLLVVTHGGSIRAARRHATGVVGDPVPNCATVELVVRDGALGPPLDAL